MNSRSYIRHILSKMKCGEHIVIDRRCFQEAYPCGWPSIYETSEQAFLSSQVGSAWGTWRVRIIPENGNRIVSKHEPSEERYYVDPDREHLFKRQRNGTFVLKQD